MGNLRTKLRFLTSLQLLPVLENGEDVLVGGQAVLEGVMMRSPHAWAITVRKTDGEMVSHAEPLDRPSDRHKWMGWPVLRGVMTLGHAMALGFRALRFSANVALEEEQKGEEKKLEIKGWVMAANVLFSVAFFIFMYKFLPLAAATALKEHYPAFSGQIAFNLVDGVIRLAIFLLFIWSVSLWNDIRRVYQYHGAEHKTVFAFESREELTVAKTQAFTTFHPRCGTSFLMTVMLISIVAYAVVPVETFWARFAIRLALLPLIMGVSYEIIRFAAKLRAKSSSGLAGVPFLMLTQPGLWLQRITTKEPTDAQVECAISALNQAMDLERARGGELVLA